MSWQGTSWAKSTRGHRTYSDKLLLFVLADYHDAEKGIAWPSQATLSGDCEMPERTVRACLSRLENHGFITTLTKGNQHQPTTYRLNLEITTAAAQSCEPAVSEPAVSGKGQCTGSLTQVHRQFRASEPAVPATTRNQEEPLEEPTDFLTEAKKPTDKPSAGVSQIPVNLNGWLEKLKSPEGRKNPVAVLVLAAQHLFGDELPESPDSPFGRIGAIAKSANGDYRYVMKVMWDTCGARPAGDCLNYVQATLRNRGSPGQGRNSSQSLDHKRREMENATQKTGRIKTL